MALAVAYLSPPLQIASGDTVIASGFTVEQIRNNVVIDSRTTPQRLTHAPTPVSFLGGSPLTHLYYEVPTMLTLTITDVIYHPNGEREVVFDDGSTMQNDVAGLDNFASDASGLEFLKKMAVAYWAARSTGYQSATPIVGKTFQLDLSLELNQFSVGSVQ